MKKKLPPYASKLATLEARGEVINLIVISVYEWKAGGDFVAPDVLRVVAPAESPFDELRWDWVRSRDVLITPPGASAWLLAAEILGAGASSVWVDEGDEVFRAMLFAGEAVALHGVARDEFRAALERHNEVLLLLGDGIFSGPDFDAARAEFEKELGLAEYQ